MRYRLVWPKTKPNTSSAIYLFCGQEIPIEYVLVLNDNSVLQVASVVSALAASWQCLSAQLIFEPASVSDPFVSRPECCKESFVVQRPASGLHCEDV